MKISGQIIDVRKRRIFKGELTIENGMIIDITEKENVADQYLMPGFIDAHVHIESSMLVPTEFARLAVVHGTVATVSDPHEIGNVLGVEGVEYMIENGKKVNFKFYFGAPSCVPATPFETAGAEIDVSQIEYLLKKPEVKYLAEMMNWPGVLHQDETVMQKIRIAHELNKPVDGHSPGLKGKQAEAYIKAGISTDHECFTKEEALDKLKHGMKIAIREGSAAKNFEALYALLDECPGEIMLCSDDKHPDNLVQGHINQLVLRALSKGQSFFNVLNAACITPIDHYKLEVGSLQKNDPADFIVVNDLKELKVLQTYINGQLVAKQGKTLIESQETTIVNQFNCKDIRPDDLSVKALSNKMHVIIAEDGQLITQSRIVKPKTNEKGIVVSDTENDVLKIVVCNRYESSLPAVGFIQSFGLKEGAIASTVAHDSHNIIAVGVDDESICKAINALVKAQGGVCATQGQKMEVLPLPIAGLMSAEDGYLVAKAYEAIDQMAKNMGSTLASPFMTLSFMALLVIPKLKLSDKGLFDGEAFCFHPLFEDKTD